MIELPITEARHELTSMPRRLSKKHETLAVTRRGKPVLAILPWEDYEAVMDTMEILGDEEMMKALRQSLKEADQGKTIPWEKVKKDLGL